MAWGSEGPDENETGENEKGMAQRSRWRDEHLAGLKRNGDEEETGMARDHNETERKRNGDVSDAKMKTI